MNIEEKVLKMLVDEYGLTVDDASVKFTDLDLDDLDTIEIICWAEEEFGIAIEDDDSNRIGSVQDLINCIGRYTV